jgi:pimeloyl-ACP methyl ester carboxylesterase
MTLFCLVHAAWQGASSWDLLIPELEKHGHKAVAMDLPIDNPSASLSDFASSVIQAIPENEEDIIVVGSSMAGTVIPLVAAKHPVRKLVFLGALIPHPGTSTLDQMYKDVDPDVMEAAGFKSPATDKLELFRDEPDMFNPDLIGKNPLEDETVAMELLFHDCETDVARWAISKLRNHLSPAHITEVFPLQALPNVGSSYIVCTEDRTISPTWSKYAARKRLGVEAIELPGGHCPYLSRPVELADLLVRCAEN